MPNTNQDRLYEDFIAIAGNFTEVSAGLPGLIGALTAKVSGSPASPAASSPSSAASQSSGGGVLDTLGSVAASIGENALGAVPLIRGIISLFGGGGDSPAPPELVKYVLPPAIQFEGAATTAGVRGVDYDQTTAPRPFGPVPQVPSAGPAPAQITVNVQAMDARSFLDRSSEIAAAVRDAMLNSSSLNDVVNEL